MFKVTYDSSCDSAYIYFAEKGLVKKTVVVDSRRIKGMVHIDLAEDGKIAGIEFVGCARKLLDKGVLDMADKL